MAMRASAASRAGAPRNATKFASTARSNGCDHMAPAALVTSQFSTTPPVRPTWRPSVPVAPHLAGLERHAVAARRQRHAHVQQHTDWLGLTRKPGVAVMSNRAGTASGDSLVSGCTRWRGDGGEHRTRGSAESPHVMRAVP